jgi:hypothetical protein
MFIKTIKQRVALVAASALTIGFISSVPAFAAVGDITDGGGSTGVIVAFATDGTTGTAAIRVGGTLDIDVAASAAETFVSITGGTFTARTSGGTIAVGGASITSTAATAIVALIATPSAANTNMVIRSYSGTDATGTLRDTVTVTVGPDNGFYNFVAAGFCYGVDPTTGAIETTIADDQAIVTLVKGGTLTVDSTTADLGLRTATAGVVVITSTEGGAGVDAGGNGVSTDVDAAENVVFKAIGAGTTTVEGFVAATPGTTTDTFKIRVVDSCANTAFSASDSEVHVNSANEAASGNVDDTPIFTDESTAWILIDANNAYGSNVPAGTWLATATNGAVLDIVSGSNAAAGSLSVSSVVADGDDIRVAIAQPTALQGTPLQTTVTITYGSQTIATKTILFTGDLASIKVTDVLVGKTNDQNFGSFKTYAYDSAGNQLAWDGAKLTVDGADQNVTAADAGTTSSSAGVTATNSFTCGVGAKGTTKLKVKGLTNASTYVYSPEFSATCASTPYTWSASMDKATYVPGDIAVVTITAKDSNGAAVHDPFDQDNSGTADTFSYVAGDSTTVPVVTGSNLEAVVAPAAANYFLGGKKTYSFKVGATAGNYNLSVVLGGITTDTAKTVAYSVKSSSVSNEEVLKSIVALIASINKQIQALQKLILRR